MFPSTSRASPALFSRCIVPLTSIPFLIPPIRITRTEIIVSNIKDNSCGWSFLPAEFSYDPRYDLLFYLKAPELFDLFYKCQTRSLTISLVPLNYHQNEITSKLQTTSKLIQHIFSHNDSICASRFRLTVHLQETIQSRTRTKTFKTKYQTTT